jgi:quercetin dioxygenase-like cupin family protein
MQLWPAAEILAREEGDTFRRMVVQHGHIRAGVLGFAAGTDVDDHAHLESGEVFHMLSGRATFRIDGKLHELGPGDLLFVAAGERHGIQIHQDEPVVMLVAVAPNLDDAWVPSA